MRFELDDISRRMKTNDMSETVDQNFVILLIHLTAHLTNTHTYTHTDITAAELFGSEGWKKKGHCSHFLSVITITHSTRMTTN